jgi:hypothetical protein
MKRFLFYLLTLAISLLVGVGIASAASYEPEVAPVFCIDGVTTTEFGESPDAVVDFLNSAVEAGGHAYVYGGEGAQDVNGTFYPDPEGVGFTATLIEAIYSPDVLVDTILYPTGLEATHAVAAGACVGAQINDIDHVQVCESPNFSDNLVTISVEDWLKFRGLGARKPVATPNYTPQGANSGYAGKLGLKCLGNPKAQQNVGVEVGDGAVLHGAIFDPENNLGTYGLAVA